MTGENQSARLSNDGLFEAVRRSTTLRVRAEQLRRSADELDVMAADIERPYGIKDVALGEIDGE